jgi:preprotein translocase subunit SecB
VTPSARRAGVFFAEQDLFSMATDATNGSAQAPTGPTLTALAQYVKDLSFENPNAPRVFAQQQSAPQIELQVNVGAQQIGDTDIESVLTLEGSAKLNGETLFMFELVYAGVFRIIGVPLEHMSAVVMIECPRLLFPFARQIVADAVRGGGFPPLYIDPVDFAALFQQRMQQMQESGEQTPTS